MFGLFFGDEYGRHIGEIEESEKKSILVGSQCRIKICKKYYEYLVHKKKAQCNGEIDTTGISPKISSKVSPNKDFDAPPEQYLEPIELPPPISLTPEYKKCDICDTFAYFAEQNTTRIENQLNNKLKNKKILSKPIKVNL